MRKHTFNGKEYIIAGSFGHFAVYHGDFCLAFDIMTKNDAENIAFAHSSAAQ